jgi:uncharacterized SAM-binding protein YcdF (DUF218 family)
MGKPTVRLTKNLLAFFWSKRQKIILVILGICLSLGGFLLNWFWQLRVELQTNAAQPVDTIFVLGGSINREIYAAKLAKNYPTIPILISQGSREPCILLVFLQENVSPARVWLEKCAKNTFENFVFSVPDLIDRQARRVKLITSQTHLPRAKWMAQVFFGIRGIAVEIDIAPELGVPGNNESKIKTLLDVSRSLMWSLFIRQQESSCQNIVNLQDINLSTWLQQEFYCERQANLTGIIHILRKIYHP